MDKNNLIFIGVAIAVIYLVFFQGSTSEQTKISGPWFISSEVQSNGYTQYTLEESDFDYSDPAISTLAKSIKTNSATPEEAVKKTLKYVVQNVRYSSAITINYCYNEKASDVLRTGTGDCVSMSRLVTALLRAQGIPARTMGGCLSASIRCTPTMAIVPGEEIKVTPMEPGDFKKRVGGKGGFLHEYVEIWTPGEGWRIGEATSGQIYDFNCKTYLDYGYDTNNYDRCIINDNLFWQQCYNY